MADAKPKFGKRSKAHSPLRILSYRGYSGKGWAFRDQPSGYRGDAPGSGLSILDSVQPDRGWAMMLPAARHWETCRRELCSRLPVTRSQAATVRVWSGSAMQGRNVVRIGGIV